MQRVSNIISYFIMDIVYQCLSYCCIVVCSVFRCRKAPKGIGKFFLNWITVFKSIVPPDLDIIVMAEIFVIGLLLVIDL